MSGVFSTLVKELAETRTNPRRVLHLFKKTKLLKLFNLVCLTPHIGEVWSPYGRDTRFMRRQYSSYKHYLVHQKSKLRQLDLADYEIKYRTVLRERLEGAKVPWCHKSVLCLAARLGAEVKAFLDVGCFAVGMDLNPGKDNPYVLYGDFHNIQFAADTVDVIFTNALDHVFSIERTLGEIRRVLKPNGLLIIEASKGSEVEMHPQFFEAFWWSDVGALVRLLESDGFRFVSQVSFEYPWPGEHIRFVKR